MIREYGGVRVQIPSYVLLFELDDSRPVFHRPNAEFVVTASECGFRRDDEPNGITKGDLLPAKHAVRFGRPCLRCFPELKRLPESLLDAKAGRL